MRRSTEAPKKGRSANLPLVRGIGTTAVAPEKPKSGAGRRLPPLGYLPPMKPVLVSVLPGDVEEWLYEVKFDGYRVIALKTGKSVELWSATHKPLNFPTIAQAVAELPCERAILDGEIVAIDNEGRSSFQLLQNSRSGISTAPLCLYLFDLLQLEEEVLLKQSTVARKARLASLFHDSAAGSDVRFSASLQGQPTQILDAVKRLGLEGIIAKRRDAIYSPGGRLPSWQKVKLQTEQDFVIGGYTAPEGSREHFGAVLVGYYHDGKLRFAARAGTGFTAAGLGRLYKLFQPLRSADCPFANLPVDREGRWGQGITAAKMRLCTWLEPTLVCRVRFAEWTADGGLRHPVFLGLCEDATASSVVREQVPSS